jgi:hypothetical protein
MWTTLFSLALAAAVCFSVAAIALAYSKYLARLSESATRSLVIRAPMIAGGSATGLSATGACIVAYYGQ